MHKTPRCRPSLRTIEVRVEDAYCKRKLEGDPTAYDFAATAVRGIEDLISSLEPEYVGAHSSALRLVASLLHEAPSLEREAVNVYKSAFTDGVEEELAYAAMMPHRVDHYSVEYGARRVPRRQRRF